MIPRLVLIVREDGSLQATCDCGHMDEIVPTGDVDAFMRKRAVDHVMLHAIAERRGWIR